MKYEFAIAPSATPATRNCARCGRSFATVTGREYTCPGCKKPAGPPYEALAKGTPLSFRERQVVALIRQAKTNKEIAYELCLTEGTIKEYLYRIFRKLAVTNRTELALRAPREMAATALLVEGDDWRKLRVIAAPCSWAERMRQ
jgi:DNA-binding CsgD family transcriptional regulator